MEHINGDEDTDPEGLFHVDPLAISNWLSEQNTGVYSKEIQAIQNSLGLIQYISQELKKKPYVSITQVFDTNLTPSEFTQYQELRRFKSGESGEWKNAEHRERYIFLDTIWGQDLNRADAREYARLRILESNNTISPEEKILLQGFEERISENNQKERLDFKDAFASALKSQGETMDSFQAQQEVRNRAGEITDAALGRMRKKE